ncbi:MAG: hypothetical protein NVSMB25_22840 [Thermoleophilaceae bacterium]
MKRLTLFVALAATLISGTMALAAGSPSVTTGGTSAVKDTSATVAGTVNPNGQATTYSFQYGTTPSFGFATSPTSAGSGSSDRPVSQDLAGLRPGTTYYYRLIATNSSGTAAGATQTFKTTGTAPAPLPAPAATTLPASAVQRNGATLNGTVNPRGNADVSYYFEYGLSNYYGLQTSPATVPVGTAAIPVSFPLTGLAANRRYHYRLVAVSRVAGESIGTDQTFTTGAVRALPRALTATTAPRHAGATNARFTTSGRLILPPRVSRSSGCTGRVFVDFKRGRKTVASGRVALSGACAYRFRVTLRGRLAAQTLRVSARFTGNDVLRPRASRSQSVRVG